MFMVKTYGFIAQIKRMNEKDIHFLSFFVKLYQ